MYHISEHINSSNHKINYYEQTSKTIVKLGSNKRENNNTSTCQLTQLHNSLIMSDLTPLNMIYQMLIGNMTWKKYVHLQ